VSPWFALSFTDSVLLALGILERASDQESFVADGYFDLDALPIPTTKLKASTRPRRAQDVPYIVCHVTAVTGGFGLASSALRRWRQALEDPTMSRIPPSIVEQLVAVGDIDQERSAYRALDPDRLARRLGIWQRYRGVPYHQIASQTGDVLANRRLTQRSYHAGAGNDGAGLAIDCGPGERLSDDLIVTGRHALLMLARRMKAEGARAPFAVVPHRVFSSSRRRDTDKAVWTQIVKPVLLENPALMHADYERTVGSGRPIPRSWDEDALFDESGRRL
jgi:hypothetical protein